MDDMFFTKQVLKEVKKMEGRKQQEKLAKQDQILQNFLIRINEDLEKQSSLISIFLITSFIYYNWMFK